MGFGENLSSTWIPADIALISNFSCWNFSCNSRGYSWLGMVAALCEAATREKADGQTWVLICDGHGSHVNADFIRHCREHDIVLLILPPHSSHLTQPLNVAVFGPLKKAMAVELQHIIHTEVLRIQKAEWMSAYVRARTRALSSSNIISAFSGAGLFPFSPSKVLPKSDTNEALPLDRTLDPAIIPSSPIEVSTFQTARSTLLRYMSENPAFHTSDDLNFKDARHISSATPPLRALLDLSSEGEPSKCGSVSNEFRKNSNSNQSIL